MAAAEVGFAAVSRAVVSAAADLVAGVERRVVGDENVRTAQSNAWAAICADRARAQARADMDAMVAAMAARPRHRPVADQAAETEAPRTKAPRAKDRRSQAGRAKAGQKQAGRGKNGRGQRAGGSPRSSASQPALVSTR